MVTAREHDETVEVSSVLVLVRVDEYEYTTREGGTKGGRNQVRVLYRSQGTVFVRRAL